MSDQPETKSSALKITLDRDLCIGAASCTLIAPNTFVLDDEGKVSLVEGEHDEEATILAAAESCPVRAIMLARQNGEPIFPA